MSEKQQGFRKNRSTIDAIFILRQVVEKAIELDKPAYLCCIDLTQTFDRVRVNDVLKILREKGVQNNIVRINIQLNTDNSTRINVNNNLTKKIPVATGIRQGTA